MLFPWFTTDEEYSACHRPSIVPGASFPNLPAYRMLPAFSFQPLALTSFSSRAPYHLGILFCSLSTLDSMVSSSFCFDASLSATTPMILIY